MLITPDGAPLGKKPLLQAPSRMTEHALRQLTDNFTLTPATLAHRLNPQWIPAPHLQHISLKIAQAIRKGNGRIIISVPPRHGKSELITKYTSVWGLEHFPHWNYILATYGAELSTDFGREVRDIIQNNEDLLNVRVRTDTSRAGRWKTPEGGGMAAVGIGGAITGRGANVLLIDDYIKEVKEALSKNTKDYIWDWFVTVALTRLEPGGTCIIIATRWAHDDLIGRILREKERLGHWEYIEVPALAEPAKIDGKRPPHDPEWRDMLGRKEGDALFPERYDVKALQERKETLGSFWFNAIYQQRPERDDDALTNVAWLKIVDKLPVADNMRIIKQGRIWDLAATQDGGDYTAGTHMMNDRSNNSTYITNVIRRRLSPQSVEVLVRQTAIADGTDCPVYIEQEPGSSGKTLVEYYKNSVLPEFDVIAVSHNDGKLARAQPFLAAAEAGRVYLLRGGWNDAFIDEFGMFPNGDFDDQIDTAAIGYTHLSGKKTFNATWGRRQRYGMTSGQAGSITNEPRIGQGGKAGVIFGRSKRT